MRAIFARLFGARCDEGFMGCIDKGRGFLSRLVAELVVAASGEKDDDGADDNGSVHDLYSHDRS